MPKMIVCSFTTKDYENLCLYRREKNKANSNPIKANSKPIQTQNKSKRGLPLPDCWGAQIPTGKLLGIPKPGTQFAAYYCSLKN
jgi:hypothetical protein